MENDNFNLQIFLYNFSMIILLSLWLVYITNDTKDKDFFDFLKNNYVNIHNFINKKILLLNQYQNNRANANANTLKITEDEDQNQDQDQNQRSEEQEQNKEILKYENKYLEEIRKMSKEYILNDEETETKNKKKTEYYNIIIGEYNETINNNVLKILKLSSEMEGIEQKKYVGENGEEYIVDSDGEEHWIKTEEEYKTEMEDLQKMIDKLNVEKNNKDEIQNRAEELAQNYIINQRLEKLNNCFVMEKTPLGNVLMIYKGDSFEYYSDNAIPYRYLETVARKYIKLFNCRPIYVDMEEELKIYEEKLNKQIEINEIDKKINGTKKNVFAKFKSYNKDATGRVNIVPPPKNNISNNLISSENANDKIILKENANRYKHQGKLSNFNILKKVDRKIVDKKYAMSFSDFKKTAMYGKIKNSQ